jgi:hypothetical protein
MKFVLLLELSLRHAYYSDGRCPDFALAPDEATHKLLADHRCLVRIEADRLRILAPVDDASHLLIPFLGTPSLRFDLTLQNPDFPFFTDLDGLPTDSLPVFVPDDSASLAPGQLMLSGSPAAGSKADRFARIEVPSPVSSDGSSAQPAAYFLAFAAKQVRWAYYCVTGSSTDPTQLHIVDAAPSGTAEVLLFSDSNRADLSSEPDGSDATAAQLLAQYPTLRCVRFLSDQPISCRQQPRPYLELRLGEERLVSPLPNPSPRSVAGGVLLFRVIKYRTQPLLTQ